MSVTAGSCDSSRTQIFFKKKKKEQEDETLGSETNDQILTPSVISLFWKELFKFQPQNQCQKLLHLPQSSMFWALSQNNRLLEK